MTRPGRGSGRSPTSRAPAPWRRPRRGWSPTHPTTGGAYGAATATERYYRNFGLNPDHLDDLVAAGLRVSGIDEDSEVRIVELPDLAFYVATLFVPQTSSTPASPHPLVTAFLAAAGERPEQRRDGLNHFPFASGVRPTSRSRRSPEPLISSWTGRRPCGGSGTPRSGPRPQ